MPIKHILFVYQINVRPHRQADYERFWNWSIKRTITCERVQVLHVGHKLYLALIDDGGKTLYCMLIGHPSSDGSQWTDRVGRACFEYCSSLGGRGGSVSSEDEDYGGLEVSDTDWTDTSVHTKDWG